MAIGSFLRTAESSECMFKQLCRRSLYADIFGLHLIVDVLDAAVGLQEGVGHDLVAVQLCWHLRKQYLGKPQKNVFFSGLAKYDRLNKS